MKRHWNDYWNKYSSKDYEKIAFFLGIVVLVAIAIIYSTRYKPVALVETPPRPEVKPEIEAAVEVPQPPAPKGSLIVAVKDVRQKLATVGLGDATELFIAIKSIQIHAKTEEIENRSVVASGWTTIFEGEKSFDLLQFTNNIALIAEKELEPSNYTQIRLYVSSANIKIDNPLFEVDNKTYPMYIPSNVMKVVRPFAVEANKATVLTIDFDVPRMVSRTSQGYTLGPVFKSITNEIIVTEQMIEKGKRPGNAVEV